MNDPTLEERTALALVSQSFGKIEHELRRLRFHLLQLRHLLNQVEDSARDDSKATAVEGS
jgi:hypothetical protein